MWLRVSRSVERMILNSIFENGEFSMPQILLSNEARYKISVISFRCSFAEPLNSTKILCLRTNLVNQTPFNPHQIISIFTASRNVKHFTFNIPQKQTYQLGQLDLPQGGFMICEIGNWTDEIVIEKGALQIHLQTNQ